MYDRRLRDIVRYEHGEKIRDFHIPTDVGDYRAIYRNYLHNPDLQDARARWPFVCMWDKHEFSWIGWQGLQRFEGVNRPAQRRKVAANQASLNINPRESTSPAVHRWRRLIPPCRRCAHPTFCPEWNGPGAQQSNRNPQPPGIQDTAVEAQR